MEVIENLKQFPNVLATCLKELAEGSQFLKGEKMFYQYDWQSLYKFIAEENNQPRGKGDPIVSSVSSSFLNNGR